MTHVLDRHQQIDGKAKIFDLKMPMQNEVEKLKQSISYYLDSLMPHDLECQRKELGDP